MQQVENKYNTEFTLHTRQQVEQQPNAQFTRHAGKQFQRDVTLASSSH
jgi:hypothetical protein